MQNGFADYLMQRFPHRFRAAAADFIRHDNVRMLPVHVSNVQIHQIDAAVPQPAQDFVTMPLLLRVGLISDEDGRRFHRQAMLRGELSGSFSADFNDLSVSCRSFAPADSAFPVHCNERLLPEPDPETLDRSVEHLLEIVYPYRDAARRPQQISTVTAAHRLGLRLYLTKLSADCSVQSIYAFADSEIMLPDSSGHEKPCHIPANSILIEAALKQQPFRVRMAAAQALMHAYISRYALELLRMQNHTFTMLKTAEQSVYHDLLIYQAQELAERAALRFLLPKTAFLEKYSQIAEDFGKLCAESYSTECAAKAAEFFGVSTDTVQLRLSALSAAVSA